MSSRWSVLAVATIGLVLVASAGAGSPATPLAGLVVPRSALGRVAAGLQVSLISGEVSNARAARDSYDLAETPASVAKAGRISGYRLVYGDPGYEALRRGTGLVDLGTSLDYFATAKQAQAYETKWLGDLRRVRGKNLQGVVVERVRSFPVRGLVRGAFGLRIVERFGSKRIYSTFVDFQIGRLLCEAAIRRADSASADGPAVALAGLLADRVVRYAAGKLKPTPVALPRPLGSTRPGPHAPDLRSMVLRAKDLGAASLVDGEGYTPDDEAITSYFRQFRFDARTGLILLRSSAALERTRREAAGRMLLLRSILTGPGAAETLAGLVYGSARSPRLAGVRRGLGVGDESFSVAVTFKAGSRSLEAVLVHVRRDRVIGTAIVVGRPKALGQPGTRATRYARALDGAIRRTLSNKPQLKA